MSGIHWCRKQVVVATAALLSASVLVVVPPGPTSAAARSWGPAEDLGVTVAAPYTDRRAPAIVRVRGNGTAVAAWVARGDGRVTAARRGAGGRWTTPRPLSAVLSSGASYDLAVARGRLASVVWERKVGSTWRIEETHLEGGTWTDPVRVGRGRMPETVVDGTGATTAAWRDHGVQVAGRARDGSWGKTRQVAAGGVSYMGLELATNPDGDVALAWVSSYDKVRATVRPHGRRSWKPPVTLGKGPGVTSMRLAMGAGGRALVLWTVTGVWSEQQHDYQNYVASARSDRHGQWSPTRKVTRRLGEDGGSVDLSMNGRGFALATWIQIYRSDARAFLWAARFRPDGTWTAPVRVSKAPVSWEEPRAWLDRDGKAFVLVDRSRIWQFSQQAGAGWKGRKLTRGRLLDVHGAGSRLVMVHHRKTLWFRALDVP